MRCIYVHYMRKLPRLIARRLVNGSIAGIDVSECRAKVYGLEMGESEISAVERVRVIV